MLAIIFASTCLFSFEGHFSKGDLKQVECIPEKTRLKIFSERAIFCDSLYYSDAWGHAIQDTIIPLYKYLKDENLIDKPVLICIKTRKKSTSIISKTTDLLTSIFPQAKVQIFTSKSHPCFFEDIEVVKGGMPGSGADGVQVAQYMEQMRRYGFADNIVVDHSSPEWNIVHDFVDHVIDCYDLHDVKLIPNRVYLINKNKSLARKILNRSDLSRLLKEQGYEVLELDFGNLSVRDQIIATRSSQFFVSTHGAALTNTMFLHNEASVVIIWPEDAKYFHNRVYCPFTSILLSKGVQLIEYDKPRSVWDRYGQAQDIMAPEYFFNFRGQLYLKPEKKNWDSIRNFHLACMYDIYNVDMFIENPEELVYLMQR